MRDDLIAKLRTMAERGTEHEREVARMKLATMAAGAGAPPRRPAAPSAAPAPDPGEGMTFTSTFGSSNMGHSGIPRWVTATLYNGGSHSGTSFTVEFNTGGRTIP